MEKFDFICDTVDNGIIILNSELEVFFWNKWLEHRTNISCETIKNKKLGEFFDSIKERKFQRKIKACLSLNSPTFYNTEISKYLFKIKIKKIANNIFEYMQQGVTIVPYDLERGLVAVYIYDHTLLREATHKISHVNAKLKQKNTLLNDSKKLLEASILELNLVLDTTMEAIFVFENEQCIRANQQALKLFEYDHDEVLNLSIHKLIKEESQEKIFSLFEKPQEMKLLKKSKQSFYGLVQVQIMKLEESTLKVVSIMDLTDIKVKDQLLAQQSKMAAMGEMLANIAHQWRQPLSTISTAASGLQLQHDFKLLNEELFSESLEEIVRSTQHLSQTIEDFKRFLKHDKEKVVFNLKEYLKKCANIVKGMLRHEDIKLKLDCSEDIFLYNYPNELTQAMINIITNSKDALQNNDLNDRLIFIEAKIQDGHIELLIKDNGIGIDEQIIDHIFDPYFTTKHKKQGTGLGLYMTHQLIQESMQGTIKASNISFHHNNEVKQGACFKITLEYEQPTQN